MEHYTARRSVFLLMSRHPGGSELVGSWHGEAVTGNGVDVITASLVDGARCSPVGGMAVFAEDGRCQRIGEAHRQAQVFWWGFM